MRIALVTPGFSAEPDDWAIPALLNLARTLAKSHEIHVFSQRYPARGIYRFDGLTHYALGGGQRFGLASANTWLRSSRAIIEQHQKTPFDVLHAFWADEAGFSAALAGAKSSRPVLISLGGGELNRLPDINYGAQRFLARRLTTRYALKRAALVTAGSSYQLDLCRRHEIPEKKLRLAPLGVDTQRFQPISSEQTSNRDQISKARSQRPTIIQAASLIPVKNQPLLLEILRQVKKVVPRIHLNLVGSGPRQDDLVKLALQLELSQNISWRGQVPYPKIGPLFQASHVYLQTSRHESQGMAVLEAMACGLPAVGTPVGVLRDLASRPAAASADLLASQIVELLTGAPDVPRLALLARQSIEERYSLAVTSNAYEKIYEEALHLIDTQSTP